MDPSTVDSNTIDYWIVSVAVYAAVVATGALFLEIRRWFETGPRLRLSITGNAVVMGGGMEHLEDKSFVSVNVTNVGNTPTTLRGMVGEHYAYRLPGRFGTPSKLFVVPWADLPGFPQTLPISLSPGEIWSGYMDRTDDVDIMVNTGRLFVGVTASHSTKEIVKRVPHDKKVEQPKVKLVTSP